MSSLAMEDTGAAAAAAPVVHGPLAWLYDDALTSIFGFLGRAELATVVRTCKRWGALTATTNAPLNDFLEAFDHTSLHSICSSALASRITRCHQKESSAALPFAALQLIAARMRRVRTLRFMPHANESWEAHLPGLPPLVLPRLTLSLRFGMGISADGINAFIAACALQPALQKLSLHFPPGMCVPKQVAFAPLQQKETHLQALSVIGFSVPDLKLTDQQLSDIRWLQLEQLHLSPYPPDTLHRLLEAEGPHLPWRTFPFSHLITDPIAELLPIRVPQLTELHTDSFHLDSLSNIFFLSRLPVLRHLSILFESVADARSTRMRTLLVAYLLAAQHGVQLGMQQLESLCLGSIDLRSGAICRLLQLTPQLRTLALVSMPDVGSFGMLEPVCSTLTELHIEHCHHPQLSAANLAVLQQCTRLQSMRWYQSINNGALADVTVAQLMAQPSPLLPILTHFEYELE